MDRLAELKAERHKVHEAGVALLDSVPENEKGQRVPDAEQGKTLRSYYAQLKALDEQIAEVEVDDEAAAALRAAGDKPDPKPVIYEKKDDPTIRAKDDPYLTPGEAFVQSDAYRSFMATFPEQKRVPSNWTGDPATLRGGMRDLLGLRTPTEIMRTLITSADTSAGDLVRPDWRGLIEPGLWVPTGVVNLVTTIPTSSDSIQYVKETSHTEAAASVEEATALTGTTGLKPEGGLVFDIVTDTVSTFAVWVPATKRILSDANGLAAYINQYLSNDLRRELEDQILNGTGAGDDFTGILNSGINTEGAGSGPFYALRNAKAEIQTTARTTPTAIVANPTNVAEWDLAVETPQAGATVNAFIGGGPYAPTSRTIWGMRVVESEFITEGTALVGDFRYAVLYDREQTTLSVGTVDDDFIRNIVRVLAEMRAGFGVIRPLAFSAVTV